MTNDQWPMAAGCFYFTPFVSYTLYTFLGLHSLWFWSHSLQFLDQYQQLDEIKIRLYFVIVRKNSQKTKISILPLHVYNKSNKQKDNLTRCWDCDERICSLCVWSISLASVSINLSTLIKTWLLCWFCFRLWWFRIHSSLNSCYHILRRHLVRIWKVSTPMQFPNNQNRNNGDPNQKPQNHNQNWSWCVLIGNDGRDGNDPTLFLLVFWFLFQLSGSISLYLHSYASIILFNSNKTRQQYLSYFCVIYRWFTP